MKTASMVPLTEILATLPSNEDQPKIVVDQGAAFSNCPNPVEGYVYPTVTITSWPETAAVLLVEAPGAVGKSELAQAMAMKLNWPIVKAEKAQVGSYTLSGLIQDALGFSSSYMQDIAMGRSGVIVDSLDEAHFRAGITNFLAFLENIQRSAGAFGSTQERKPSVVLLSRSDTAEFIRISFQEKGLALAEASLDFFDQTGAKGFISSYYRRRFSTTGRGEYNVDLASPIPFERLRKERFAQVAQVLQGGNAVNLDKEWHTVRDFLGYAPVLIALAEFLAVTNPAAERESRVTAFDQRALLHDIVERILTREHRKLSSQIRDKLQASLPAAVAGDIDAPSLYTPAEQLIRLASRMNHNDLIAPPPAGLPQPVRALYEDAVGSFISDHPFIRGTEYASIVFSDYVLATVCTSLEARAALATNPEKTIVSVGPFFASFTIAQFESSQASIREGMLGSLLASWSQEGELRGGDEHYAASVLLWDEGSGTATLVKDQNTDPIEVSITDCSGALHLRGALKHLSLVSDQGVILGSRNEHLILGPGVFLVANEVDIDCLSIFIEKFGSQPGVVLGAHTLSANYLTQIDARPDTFFLVNDNPPPRLRPFRQDTSSATSERYVPFSDYVCLRSILTSFRPSVKGGPSVWHEKLENTIVKQKSDRLRVFELLKSSGCIVQDGNHYRLDLNVLAHFGFSINDVKSGQPNDAILSFLAREGPIPR